MKSINKFDPPQPPQFRVIIAGGRTFTDYALLEEAMGKLLSNVIESGADVQIVSGTAHGADKLGEQYAETFGFDIARFPADWTNHGNSAGYKRNAVMAEYSDALVAFWDKESRGTKHMIDLATKRGLKVRVVNY